MPNFQRILTIFALIAACFQPALGQNTGPVIELGPTPGMEPYAPPMITPGFAWQIEALPNTINSTQDEYTPFISPDGRMLFFQSNRPGGYGSHDLWFSANQAWLEPAAQGKWGLPQNLNMPVNSKDFEGMPSVLFSPAGMPLEIYFTAIGDQRPSAGQTDLYVSRYANGSWSTPQNLVILNSAFHDRMPFISGDGQYLYFSSDRPGGLGKSDIYYSVRLPNQAGWSSPINLGPMINTAYNELCPSLYFNNQTMYFSSDRPGGGGGTDIYYSHKVQNSWQKPENIGPPLNTPHDEEYPTVTADAQWMFFASDRPGSLGGFDIFRGNIPPMARPALKVRFEGVVLDGDPTLGYEKALDATMRISGGPQVIIQPLQASNFVNPGHRNFIFDLDSGADYTVEITRPGYFPVKTELRYSQIAVSGFIDKHRFLLMPLGEKKLPPPALEPPGATEQKITILGRLVDRDSGAPIGNGTVGYSFNEISIVSLPVDPEGRFKFEIGPNQMGKNLFLKSGAPGYPGRNDQIASAAIQGPVQEVVIKLAKYSTPVVLPNKPDGTFPDPTTLAGSELKSVVYFGTAVYKITGSLPPAFPEVMQWLKANPTRGLVVAGHADHTGNAQYNQHLSYARAYEVYRQLLQAGVDPKRLLVKGLGFSKEIYPLASEATLLAKNRRVEFIPFELAAVTVPAAAVPPEYNLLDKPAPVIKKPAKKAVPADKPGPANAPVTGPMQKMKQNIDKDYEIY